MTLEAFLHNFGSSLPGSVAKLAITDCYLHHIVVLPIIYSTIWYGSESLRQSRKERTCSCKHEPKFWIAIWKVYSRDGIRNFVPNLLLPRVVDALLRLEPLHLWDDIHIM